MSDIYVVVCENNKTHTMPNGQTFRDDGGPLVFEQYTRHADIENARKRAARLEDGYGPCRIAKLVFVED